jgi:hypothetical protein
MCIVKLMSLWCLVIEVFGDIWSAPIGYYMSPELEEWLILILNTCCVMSLVASLTSTQSREGETTLNNLHCLASHLLMLCASV